MEIMNKANEISYLDTLAGKLKADALNYPIGLRGGLLGMGLFFYWEARKHKNDEWQELADHLLDLAMEKPFGDLSCSFGNGLSGIGWGIGYLLEYNLASGDVDEVLEDFNMFFRKKLMLNRASVDEVVGMGIYFVGQAKLRCSDPLSIEMKRIDRNMLLCLRRMEKKWKMICEHEDKLLLLQCFSVLIDFYRFNVFRFKVTRLINSVLLLLRENREALGLLECVYATRLLAKLYSIGCADDSFWELSKNIYDSFINGLGPEGKELATVSSSFILKSDEQYYLMTEDQYCIPLV